MKKIVSMVLCLMLLGMVFAAAVQPASAAGSAHMSIRSSSGTLYRGDTFTLTVSLSNDQPVSNGGVVLSFDSGVFEFLGGSCHVANATLAEVSASRKGGVFVLATDAVVSGTIFTIKMRVKDSASFGSYSISGSPSLGGVSCGLSGTSVTVACGHSYGSATNVDGNNHERACTICGQKKTEAHSWNSGTVTKAATCKETGIKRLTCTGCSATKDETIPVTNDHKYGGWTKVSDAQHSRACTVCAKKETASHSWNNGTVTKAATCKETGVKKLTCTGCSATKEQTIPVSDNHQYGSWSKVSDSQHSHTCGVCGKKETKAHSWNSGTVLEKATCLQTGKKKLDCTGCSATKTETIPIADHAYGNCVYVDAAGHKRTCGDCGKETTEAHVYGGWLHDENWHFRRCEGCGNEAEQAAHAPGPKATEVSDQICTICGRILQPRGAHVHSFDQEWSTDEMGHWHACDDCNEKDSAAPHEFDDACDADCNVCGMMRQPAHAPAAQWTSDETGHWYACGDCGEKVDFDPHTAGPEATITSAQTCTVCGFEMAPVLPHDHVFDGQGTIHSHSCPCGERYEAEAKDCEVCASFPWWILCVLEALVFGGVLAFLLLRMKKGKG